MELFSYDSFTLENICNCVINKKRIWSKEQESVFKKIQICGDVVNKIVNEFVDKSGFEYLYWIPWDNGFKWTDDINSGLGSVISRMESLEIRLGQRTSGYICFLGYNSFVIHTGMAGLF